MALLDWISGRIFNAVHRNNLVYNTCWEDPRLDRVALDLRPDDTVVVITSAGCNTLDYALTGPKHIYAVDMNPRQNALLELKIAAIKNLEYEDFYRMFGQGRLPGAKTVYREKLRDGISDWSRKFWDKKIKLFDHPHRTFYFRGTSGYFARLMNFYADRILNIRRHVNDLLEAKTVEEQRRIYEDHLHDRLWPWSVRFIIKRDTMLSMVGVPKAQRRQIETQYEGGILKYVQDCVASVFSRIPIAENYFWRVYMTGQYTPQCCPEYLKPENFQRLRDGLVDRISTHTDTMQGFLEKHDEPISRFVLLDHMDWLSDKFFPLLETEWEAIVRRATPTARAIWRSGGLRTDFLDRVQVRSNGNKRRPLGELLSYHRELANELHAKDRVHTYGSFYIADVAAA